MKIRILIVDDHRIFREGLRMVLNLQADMEVVGEAKNGEEAIAKTGELLPDIIIMDAKMPVMDGVEATRRIIAEMPGMKILAHSMYSGDEFTANMMNAGAKGYILKGCDFVELCDTIRRAAQNLS